MKLRTPSPRPAQPVDAATSFRMRKVRRVDTAPELTLRKALTDAGVRGYRKHPRKVLGRPDIAWIGRRGAVFVDGAFWHGHPSRYWMGRSGPYWDARIARNMERDRRTTETLTQLGWTVIRFWDFEVSKNVAQCVDRIRSTLESRGPSCRD